MVTLNMFPNKKLKPKIDEYGSNSWHPNVYWMLIFRFISGLAFATRSAAIFDNYIRMQFGDNTTIGMLSSSSALAHLMAAPMAAFLSDNFPHKRSMILRLLGAFGLICLGLNYFGLTYNSLTLLMSSSFCWSIWYQMVNIVSESLLTDSLPPDKRSEIFVYKRITATVSRGMGPLITLSLFLWCGDSWDINIVRTVLKIGLTISFIQIWALWFWNDIEKAELESERYQQSNIKQVRTFLGLGIAALPWLIYISHNVTFLGAGMTVKYFPLFFIQEFDFKPIHTCLLSTSYSITLAAFTYIVYLPSKTFGRIPCALTSTTLGMILLYLLTKSYRLPLVIGLYLLRGGLQNAASPLNRSVIQEIIPSNKRGKWFALESMSGVAWSTSAVFGGLLADAKDYRYTFTITGLFYLIGNLLYTPCLFLVKEVRNYESNKYEEAKEKLLGDQETNNDDLDVNTQNKAHSVIKFSGNNDMASSESAMKEHFTLAFFRAVGSNDSQLVKAMLKNPLLDINAQVTEMRVCALEAAINLENIEMVKDIAQVPEVDFDLKNANNSTPFMHAVKIRNLEIVRILVESKKPLHIKDEVFIAAARNNDLATFNLLLSHSQDKKYIILHADEILENALDIIKTSRGKKGVDSELLRFIIDQIANATSIRHALEICINASHTLAQSDLKLQTQFLKYQIVPIFVQELEINPLLILLQKCSPSVPWPAAEIIDFTENYKKDHSNSVD